MEKKVKQPLTLQDNYPVRTLEELQQYFDLERIKSYFKNGQLANWLQERYYETHYSQIIKLSIDETNLDAKLCSIFDIDFQNIQEMIKHNTEETSPDESVQIRGQTSDFNSAETLEYPHQKKAEDKVRTPSPTPSIKAGCKNIEDRILPTKVNTTNSNKGNKLIWKVLNLLISILNWIVVFVYTISGFLCFNGGILLGANFIIGSIIICPLVCSLIALKKGWSYKKKFLFKILQLGIGYSIMLIIMIAVSMLDTFS